MRKVTTILLALILTGSIPLAPPTTRWMRPSACTCRPPLRKRLRHWASCRQTRIWIRPTNTARYACSASTGLKKLPRRLNAWSPASRCSTSTRAIRRKLVQMYPRDTSAPDSHGRQDSLCDGEAATSSRGRSLRRHRSFAHVLALIAKVHETHDTTLADLKLLAEGFGKLADQQLAMATARPSAQHGQGWRPQ